MLNLKPGDLVVCIKPRSNFGGFKLDTGVYTFKEYTTTNKDHIRLKEKGGMGFYTNRFRRAKPQKRPDLKQISFHKGEKRISP